MTIEMLKARLEDLKNHVEKITQEYSISMGRLNEAMYLFNAWEKMGESKEEAIPAEESAENPPA